MVQEGLSAAEECLCLGSSCERFTATSSQNYITPPLVLGYESQKSITPLQYFKWHQSLYILIFRTGISARPCLYSCIFQKFSFIIFKLIECCGTVHLCVCISTCVFLCFYRCVYVCVEGGLRAWRTWPSNAGLSQSVYLHYSWMSGRGEVQS